MWQAQIDINLSELLQESGRIQIELDALVRDNALQVQPQHLERLLKIASMLRWALITTKDTARLVQQNLEPKQ